MHADANVIGVGAFLTAFQQNDAAALIQQRDVLSILSDAFF